MPGVDTPAVYRAGAGEPLVLVHGAEADWTVWRPVLGRLCEHYEVHAPTLPGHLGGPPLRQPISITAFADGLEAYLDSVGLDTAHVAGNSLGGILAMEMVRRGRARSAVSFSGPAGFASDQELVRLLRLFAFGQVARHLTFLNVLARRSPSFRKRLQSAAMVHGDRVTPSEFDEMATASTYARIAIPLVRSVRAGDRPTAFDVGTVPSRVVWGAEEKVVPLEGYGEPSHALVRGAELHVLPDAGHVPMWDAPDAVVDHILATASLALEA
jgi:pimeloyl-ACP methyl ester carboxylesterase